MNKLTEEQIQKLIDFVQARPALYHKGHGSYKKVEQKERMWKEIASNLCADEKDCKAAWRCLEDQFVRRYKEFKGKTGQSAHKMSAKYKNFERLLFLKDSLEPRKHCSNFDDEVNSDLMELNSQTIFEEYNSQGTYEDFDFSEVTAIRTVPVPEISPVSTCSGYMFPGNSASTSRKRKISVRSNFAGSACASNTTAVPEVSPTEMSYDADNFFSTTSSSSFKRKKTDPITDEFSGFLKKLTNSVECEEQDNIDTFFQSIAKSAKAFKLTHVQMSKLMLGTTELLHKIVSDSEQNTH